MFILSLSSGTMPDALKIAELLPAIKKPDADFTNLSFYNFRPNSNLKMVSKVIEKAVVVQLIACVYTHHLNERFQSGYKLYHSAETALVRVQNDILCAIDSNHTYIHTYIHTHLHFLLCFQVKVQL